MQEINASYSNKLIVLTITIATITLIAYCVFSLWNINHWQESVLKKAVRIQPSIPLKKVALPKEKLLKEKLTTAVNHKEQSLVFTKVDLPEAPELPKQPKPFMPVNPVNEDKYKNISTVKASDKASDKRIVKPIVKPIIKETEQSALVKQRVPSAKQPNKATMKSVSNIYQQLISDDSIDIELAWPNQKAARKDIFSFLYQCVGMRFGVLNNQKVFLANTAYHQSNAHKKQQTSQWLRIAQGQLTNQERHWLQQYNLAGTPVRLFPKVVDWQLSTLINKQLNGEPLRSVRAHYKYNNRRLMLTNISLNGRQVDKDWQLIEKQCLPSA